jgi:membrane-bound lytic murein transglycosylase B
MNSTTGPADVQWMSLGIDEIIDRCNEQETTPASAAEAAAEVAQPPLTPAHAGDGILGRFGRVAASFFRGSAFSTLGKRKERDGEKKDEPAFKKEQYERTYADMKAQGLFTPKVMVRPRTQQQRAAGKPLPELLHLDT